MSGGQRQAVACARAIAFGKRIVILDEPTSALGAREAGNVLQLDQETRRAGHRGDRDLAQPGARDGGRRPRRRAAPGPLRRRGGADQGDPREARLDDRRRRRGGEARSERCAAWARRAATAGRVRRQAARRPGSASSPSRSTRSTGSTPRRAPRRARRATPRCSPRPPATTRRSSSRSTSSRTCSPRTSTRS